MINNIDNISEETIFAQINEWVNLRISKKFVFREHQLECICRIIKNILEHKYQNYIIEAPTGSGKSLINIISAGVLAEYYNVTSYILVSDLFLWEQYENFLKKYKHTGIAALKGQTGNYKCLLNGEDIKNADCRMSGLSWYSLFNKTIAEENGYDCAANCEYVKARKKAIKAKVCIMTYQLFLFIMNNPQFNKNSNNSPIFTVHDVLFCDECHNIPEIVQLQYSPTISPEDFDKLECLYYQDVNKEQLLFDDKDFEKLDESEESKELSKEDDESNPTDIYELYPKFSILKEELDNFWKIWTCVESRKDEDIAAANKYLGILCKFTHIVQRIKADIMLKKQLKQHLSKDDIKLFKMCSWHENYMCHWNDYCTAINETGEEYELKDINVDQKLNDVQSVSFKCTKEDYITWFFLLRKAQHKVMLSATVGDKAAYDERMGFSYEEKNKWDHENAIVNESFFEKIPSTFDFTESPVHFLNKFKMSFRERQYSFNHLKTIIYSICKTKFANQKGMIQTGSYEFANRLFNEAPPEIKQRMLIYNGSREKNTIIQIHKLSENTILVGPTLNTGIDLPGDDCRFIIILKVPYPTLMDKLVNERNKLYPLWYNWHTSNEIIQGIGRGIRYNGDWCITYIFDACFNNLYHSTKHQYPKELQDRINII